MKPEVAQLCKLLEVDDILINHGLNHSTISVRIGESWMSDKIDFLALARSENMQADIGRVVFALTKSLRKSLAMDEAAGERLDQLAEMVGVTREPARPMTRFEVIAEELKKL